MSQIANVIKNKLAERAGDEIVQFGQQTIAGGAFLKTIEDFERYFRSFPNHDCIALNLITSPTALACFIASLSVANNTAYLDTNWPGKHLEKTLDSIGADLVIEDQEADPFLTTELQPKAIAREGQTSPITAGSLQSQPKFTCFTSGTTGAPKGCVRSHASWIASFEADQGFAKIGAENVVVVLGSFAHSLGIYAAARGLYAGAKVMLFPKFDASKVAKQIQSVSDAIIFGVPTQYVSLARALREPTKCARRLLTTGAKLPEVHVSSIRRAFPDAEIIEFYGTSELSYVSARKIANDDPPTTVGKPLDGVQIALKKTDETNAENAKIGLIQVQSQLAFGGYIIDGKFTPAPDWISVGDTGFLGEGGNLHLVGRIDRMFQTGGRNIVPEAIEAAILGHGSIKNVAAFGLPDPVRENRIVSVIEADENTTRSELVEYLSGRIVSYTIPQKFYLCIEWPKTSVGKTDYRTLKDQILSSALDELS